MQSDIELYARSFRVFDISDEPFFDVKASLSNLTNDQKVFINQNRRQQIKWEFYLNALDFLSDSGIQGNYFEFGCHKARTFRMAMAAYRFFNLPAEFLAFDSFEGLPPGMEGRGVHWKTGALSTSEARFRELLTESGFSLDKVRTVPGFYADSLNEALRKDLGELKTNLVTIDCDYYESAVDVFNFVEPYLQYGSVIYLDDVFGGFTKERRGGVLRAFEEFRARSTFSFVDHLSIGWWGRSYIAY